MNSRIAFKNTLQNMNTGRPVFIPFVYRLAAKIEQVPLLDMVSDPTYYANLLEGAYQLLKYDAIITSFDPSLEAEIFGCELEWPGDYALPVVKSWSSCELETAGLERSSRIPVMLEAARRLVMTRGREAAIIGAVTGPCTLAWNIAQHAGLEKKYGIEEIISLAGSQLTKLTRSLCEVKVDAIIFREDFLGEKYREELFSLQKPYTSVYTTLFNLTRYFNISPLILIKAEKPETIEAVGKMLRPGGIILLRHEIEPG